MVAHPDINPAQQDLTSANNWDSFSVWRAVLPLLLKFPTDYNVVEKLDMWKPSINKLSKLNGKKIINYNENRKANLSLQSGQRHLVTQEQLLDVLHCLSKTGV